MGYLQAFAEALSRRQARQVEREALRELKRETESFESPVPDRMVPSLHAWLLKYDINKYLHVVLLHDRALHQKPGYSADRSVIEDYQTHFLALK